MIKNSMLTIVFSYIITDYRIVTTTKTRRELQAHSTVVNLINLNRNYLLKLLDALLNLNSLSCLIAETLNKSLDIGYFLLLILISTKLLFTTFFSQYKIFIVFNAIILGVTTCYFNSTICYIINKRTVVAHKNHCFGTLLQELFEPLNTLNIQMVGRLIKKKNIRLAKKNLSQLDTHAPTTRELSRRAIKIRTIKAETSKRTLYFSFIIITTHHHKMLVCLSKSLYKLRIRITFIICAVSHLLLHTIKF